MTLTLTLNPSPNPDQAPPPVEEEELSEFEHQRLRNIARNQELLAKLGLA